MPSDRYDRPAPGEQRRQPSVDRPDNRFAAPGHQGGYEPPWQGRPRRRRLIPMISATLALIGFGLVVWYAYNWGSEQGQRAADLPLVQAEATPEKHRPEEPGGLAVPHQDSLVLNQADRQTDPRVERLLPPPEVPQPPPAALPPQSSPQDAPGASARPAEPPQAVAGTGAVPEASSSQDQAAATAEAPAAAPATDTAAAAPQAPPAADLPTGSVAPVPAVPPKPVESAALPPKPTEAPAQPAAPKAPTGAESFSVQLAAVRSQEAAQQEWRRLQAAFPAILGKKSLAIERTEVKGTEYFRLQAVPFSEAEAGEACDKLKGAKQGCLVKKR